MATLASVALKVAKQLGRVNVSGTEITDLAVEIKEEIGEAVKFYNRQPWALTEVRGLQIQTIANTSWYRTVDLTTGEGDQDLTGRSSLPVSDILDINYMRVDEDEIDEVSYNRFERLTDGTASLGDPTHYTKFAGSIGFWPMPDKVYTIYIGATVKPVVPTADTDESVWFDEAEELILTGAVKRVLVKYTRDAERAAQYTAIERDAMDQFQSEHIRKTSSGRVRSHE